MRYRIAARFDTYIRFYQVEQADTGKTVFGMDAYASDLDDEQIRRGIAAFMGTLGWTEAER